MQSTPLPEADGISATAESNTAEVRLVTPLGTTDPETEISSTTMETDKDYIQAHPVIPSILEGGDEKEKAIPTCPSLMPRPQRPIHWEDTYIDIQSMQRSQTVVALEEAVQAHSLAITIVDKSEEEDDDGLFVNVSLDLKNEGGQETGVEGEGVEGEGVEGEVVEGEVEEEGWGFACGLGWLGRWWRRG